MELRARRPALAALATLLALQLFVGQDHRPSGELPASAIPSKGWHDDAGVMRDVAVLAPTPVPCVPLHVDLARDLPRGNGCGGDLRHLWNSSNTSCVPPQRVAVITMDTTGAFPDLVFPNRREYCERHGFTFLAITYASTSHGRDTNWGKIPVVLELLAKGVNGTTFDWYWWLDADAVILNMRLDLRLLLLPGRDLVFAGDRNCLNAGSFIFRNSEFSRWFFRTVWDIYPTLEHAWSDQASIMAALAGAVPAQRWAWLRWAFYWLRWAHVTPPKGWAALQRLLCREQYEAMLRPMRTAEEVAALRPVLAYPEHTLLVPQCVMNSATDRFQEGDFVIHFAGHQPQNKLQFIRDFLLRVLR